MFFQNLSDEEMLQLALEASAREAGLLLGKNASAILQSTYETTRHALLKHKTKHTPEKVTNGIIVQANICNQAHSFFHASIKEFKTACSICGYLSLALTMSVSKYLNFTGSLRTKSELLNLFNHLRSETFLKEELLPLTRNAMKTIKANRETYIQKPLSNVRNKIAYLKSWVANYEISDVLIQERINCIFFRFNQWPEYESATYEEKERLYVEERQFGGRLDKKTKTLKHLEGESVYFFETFLPVRDECKDTRKRDVSECKDIVEKEKANIFLLDLNGHFSVGITSIIDGTPHCVVINTTTFNYIESDAGGMAIAATFDAAFS
eukprot:GSMAST32.ASY1.ANO1.1418.1 assembled CDS